MMFLEFFVWGAWYTSIAVYMTAVGMKELTHWAFTVNPVAAIAAPFFLGLIVLGGLVLLVVPQLSGVPLWFILALLLYNLCYMPTLGLANSLAFHHIQSQEKQFPLIRVFGTIGWIVAGLFVSYGLKYFVAAPLKPEQTALPVYASAIASLLLGVYSFSLPHTPPPAAGQRVSVRSIVGVDALKQLGSKPFYVFLISSLLICIPLAAYYNFTQLFLEGTGFQSIAGTQTIGQASETIFMLLMPVFFVRLGVKWMLVAGMGAWVVRYGLFALGAPSAVVWMIIVGIALHGMCYDFFFVTGQIYVDKKSTPQIRGQAQGLLVLATYGVGMLIGAQAAGNLYDRFLGQAPALTLAQWRQFWFIPAAFAAVVMVLFAALFYDRAESVAAKGAKGQPIPEAT
jgi:nucleoside transporter